MAISSVQADHYRIPLPVALSDSTHGTMEAFELVTVRVRDADGAEGLGYTYTVGAGGGAIHNLITRDLGAALAGARVKLIRIATEEEQKDKDDDGDARSGDQDQVAEVTRASR